MQEHPKNVRRGDVEAIMESLRSHGQYRPLLVQESTNYVIAGNHTLQAAIALGWEHIAVSYIKVTDDQALKIMLVDNRTNDLASYDESDLMAVLNELEVDLVGTGFDTEDLADLRFKLGDGDGTYHKGETPTERKSAYEAAGITSIVLPYPNEVAEEMHKNLKRLQADFEYTNNSDVVKHLVEAACSD